jgi:hypothetical protein
MMGTSTHDTKHGRRLPTVSGWTRRLSPVLNGGYEIHSYALSSSIVEGVSPILDKRVTTKSQFEGLYRRKYCISLTSVAEGSASLSVNNKHTEICKIARPVKRMLLFLHRCRCDFRGVLKMTRDQRFFNDRKFFFEVTSGQRIVQGLCNIQSGKE